MSTPYHNAKAECFLKKPKKEEMYRNQYYNLEEARADLTVFLDNVKRLHLSLGYLLPMGLETDLANWSVPAKVYSPSAKRTVFVPTPDKT